MVFGNMGETSATGVGFTRNPGHRREGVLRRVPGERAGRRRGGRHPHAAPHLRARRRGMPRSTTSFAKSPPCSRSTIATSRISSSPFRTASSTCCRPATASAPVRRRCASRWRWWQEGLIDKKEAILRVEPQQLDQLLHPVLDPASKKTLDQAGRGPAGIARRRGRHDRLHGQRGRGSLQEGARDPGSQRDRAGRHSRHGSGQGHSHCARRHDQPRGGGLPRHGHALRGRRGGHHGRRAQEGSHRHGRRQEPSP